MVSIPFCARDPGDVGGRLDPQAGDAGLEKIPQEIAVVAGDLQNQAFASEAELADVSLRRLAGVAQHGFRERGEIKVFREQLHRRDQVGDLHQPALLANQQAQGEAGLGFGQILGSQQVVGQRLQAEIERQSADASATGAAMPWGIHQARAWPSADALAEGRRAARPFQP